jgi:heptosyltransferase I
MHFLILKTSSLGDILHAFPSLCYLRQKFPHAHIDWVVEAPFSELVSSHPDINRVITLHTKKWRNQKSHKKAIWQEIKLFYKTLRDTHYDVVFDLQGNLKSSLILSCVKAKEKVGFGRKSVHEWPNLLFTSYKANPPKAVNIREDNLYLLQSFFKDPLTYEEKKVLLKITKLEEDMQKHFLSFGNPPHILVCPGSFWPNKQISVQTLKSVLKSFEKNPFFFFTWGNEQEKIFAETLFESFSQNSLVLPKLSLPLLQNLMEKMDLVIAMDSLPLHLAGVAKAKTLSFFGPSLGKKFAPLGERHHFFQGSCPYNQTFKKRCRYLRTCKTGACLKQIDEDSLINITKKIDIISR